MTAETHRACREWGCIYPDNAPSYHSCQHTGCWLTLEIDHAKGAQATEIAALRKQLAAVDKIVALECGIHRTWVRDNETHDVIAGAIERHRARMAGTAEQLASDTDYDPARDR